MNWIVKDLDQVHLPYEGESFVILPGPRVSYALNLIICDWLT